MTNKLDILTFLIGIKENYSCVKYFDIKNGNYGRPRIVLTLKDYTKDGEYSEYNTIEEDILLYEKRSEVVEEGEHQGWENGKPIAYKNVLRSNIELALEIKAIIKTYEENKEIIVLSKKQKQELNDRIFEIDINIDKQLEEAKKQNLSSIDPETLTSDFKMIEQ